MTNLLPQSRHSNPFESSGEDDQPQQLHNKYKRKSKKLKRNVKEEDKPFIQNDNIKIKNEVSKEYNPFSSSEEEEDKFVQRVSTAENIRAKRAGLVAVLVGIILLFIVIMTENMQVFQTDLATTGVDNSDVIDRDMADIHITDQNETDRNK